MNDPFTQKWGALLTAVWLGWVVSVMAAGPAAGADRQLVQAPENVAQQEHRRQLGREFVNGVDELYQDAVELFKAGEYDLAGKIFANVNGLWPGYRQTEKYIRRIHQKQNAPAGLAGQSADPHKKIKQNDTGIKGGV